MRVAQAVEMQVAKNYLPERPHPQKVFSVEALREIIIRRV
jgi:hypothetical protein